MKERTASHAQGHTQVQVSKGAGDSESGDGGELQCTRSSGGVDLDPDLGIDVIGISQVVDSNDRPLKSSEALQIVPAPYKLLA